MRDGRNREFSMNVDKISETEYGISSCGTNSAGFCSRVIFDLNKGSVFVPGMGTFVKRPNVINNQRPLPQVNQRPLPGNLLAQVGNQRPLPQVNQKPPLIVKPTEAPSAFATFTLKNRQLGASIN